MSQFLMVIILAFSISACSGKRLNYSGGDRSEVKGVVALSVDWVKDKQQKFDAMVNMENIGDEILVIKTSDFRCMRGEEEGYMKNKFSKRGQRYIVLDPDQRIKILSFCQFDSVVAGDFKFMIKKIYEGDEDGERTKKVMAKDVQWIGAN